MDLQDAYSNTCIHELYKHNLIDRASNTVQCMRCREKYICRHNNGTTSHNDDFNNTNIIWNGIPKYCKICKLNLKN